ncbi:MAG: response regulator transcription factor [Salinivirgaceae bacterium]|nr:response regulator transcription factor [Salinivirgaceae bacterium]
MINLRILIIEDEKPAADKLERQLKKYNDDFIISGPIESVAEAVKLLELKQNEFDLLFLDIRLIDGESFSIFEKVKINKPVIFTTAYDNYALEAFKLNSIDYILKPYTFDSIKIALDKFYSLSESLSEFSQKPSINMEMIQNLLNANKKQYKTRFMVRKGEKIKAIETDDIKLFYADDRDVYLLSTDNRRYAVNQKLEETCNLVDPKKFFRVNRTFLVQYNAIEEVIAYSNSRLKLNVNFKFDKDIIVSREKVNDFKRWMEGEE